MSSTRRQFLHHAALGTIAAGALPALLRSAPAETSSNSDASPAASPGRLPVLVDWHSHVITPGELRFLAGRSKAPRVISNAEGQTLLENVTTVSGAARRPSPTSASDIAARLRNLDANGVQRQLLSYTVALGYDATLPIDEQRVLFRALNDELAGIVQKYPGRFLGVAALPSSDPAWAAKELKRAHQELGLIGGALPLNAFATLEGARTLAPLFAEGQKLGSHFFIHRAPASSAVPGQPPLILPTDTESVRWNVISNTHLVNGAITLGLTDFLDPYPDVSVQVIMLGGFLPYLISSLVNPWNGGTHEIKDPVARLRRLYFDPGPYSRNGEWVALAVAKLGADRILFGTDYGVGGGANGDVGPAVATLDRTLTADQRNLIYVENSRTLLKAKGRA
jgi:predicted TIM-barrel fold metal-dependent hydrolase